jgi:hypothetical protein
VLPKTLITAGLILTGLWAYAYSVNDRWWWLLIPALALTFTGVIISGPARADDTDEADEESG